MCPNKCRNFGQMKNNRNRNTHIAYLALLLLFVLVVWGISHFNPLQRPGVMPTQASEVSAWGVFLSSVWHHMKTSVGTLLLQIVVILTLVRFVGWIFKKINQPAVIGEIVAGILLGPSLLGWLWPEGMNFLFPESSLPNIELLSQFGLILFMFTIGMELRLRDIRKQARQAMIISQAGIFIPFILGMLLTLFVFRAHPEFEVPFLSFALFTGIAMSITAFPVLARIIQERNMGRSPLGKLALSTAAAGDVIAWLMLAAVMAVTQSGSFTSALFNMLFLLLYLLLIFFVLRPLFDVIGRLYNRKEVVNRSIVGIIFILLLISAYLTDILSMHALFGAFMLGLIMPEDLKFRSVINEKIEDVALLLFLPLFFVSSGLRTSLGLIDTPELWLLFILFTCVAIVGKMGGTYLFARIMGIPQKNSLYLGAFMNTRGLMELVVLRIGLDLGVLPPVIFAILVLMTLVTTFMTAPLIQFIDFLYKSFGKKTAPHSVPLLQEEKRVLISFGRPETGQLLTRLAHQLFLPTKGSRAFSLLHVTMDADVTPINAETFYQESFSPALQEARTLHIEPEVLYRVSDAPSQEIIGTANRGTYDFLLVGAGLNLSDRVDDKELVSHHRKLKKRWSRFSITSPEALLSAKNMFQDKTNSFVSLTECPVGIFINRSFRSPRKILLPLYNRSDLFLLPYARNMQQSHRAELFLLPVLSNPAESSDACREAAGTGCQLLSPAPLAKSLAGYDLLIISHSTWTLLLDLYLEELSYLPSTLIIRR